ncbi:uncharacterized protein LOC126843524 isoform X3 [Adelges cooleyi]|uniref:uncharacterized protein LOC126843524 isoform X3 n=1 Tax=Adelges cooleyi TaxID=133065 RepID=UPI00217F8784|nr:uncharacterized protein LOC126843524 isoform X3 [Adelges cooleyi]
MNLKYPISMFLIFINYWIANSDETHEKRKTKELWKILEQKEVSETEEKRLGYTSAADLIIEYPKQADKIAEWITKNPGSDEGPRPDKKKRKKSPAAKICPRFHNEPTILKKPRFEAIMQSDTLIPAEDLEQAKEVEKLWKIIELKDIVGSKEVGLTTRTHVLSVLPDHTEKIFEWIEKNPGSIKVNYSEKLLCRPTVFGQNRMQSHFVKEILL